MVKRIGQEKPDGGPRGLELSQSAAQRRPPSLPGRAKPVSVSPPPGQTTWVRIVLLACQAAANPNFTLFVIIQRCHIGNKS
ncbi:hypothetical protein LX36DRAFT_37530 [Colletotrichum falcatum]|nr:hypothetical protein LX36DRAFT_37530 [Colletotrichum falcatum]